MKISLKYSLIDGGFYAGIPALFLSPGGTELEQEELPVVIEEQFQKCNMRFKALVIDTREALFTHEEVASLMVAMSVMADNGVSFIAYVPPTSRQAYLRLVPHIVVFLGDEQEPFFPVQEIRWQPDKVWDEPPLLKFKSVHKYLVPGSKGVQGAFEFLLKCEKTWGIILPSKVFSYPILE